ncbi:glycosyl hydrolase family 61-domain-containing protein [Aspergillus aurantiobrunneus]
MHVLSLLAVLPLAASHTVMSTLYVDGQNQGDGVCIRQHRDEEKATYPISPLASDAMACGFDGEKASTRLCPASQGSTLTFEFREWPDASNPGAIDKEHKGPCAVYMKPVADATADNNAAGDGWFKVFEMDYDQGASQWCTEKLIANNGFMSVKVPHGIRGGDYLVRTELLALHAARENPPDPQFYVGCAQVFVHGGEDGDVPQGVVIDRTTYDLGMEGLTYDIYAGQLALPYPRFGPEVYRPGSSSARGAGGEVVQKKGFEPEGCVVVRDDWCGFEVPSYSDEQGCWASSANCWDQSKVCWETAPPTGSKGCHVWEDKCNNIDEQCNAGNFDGPPNKGKVLTPELKGVGGSMDVFTGGESSSDYEGTTTVASASSASASAAHTGSASGRRGHGHRRYSRRLH